MAISRPLHARWLAGVIIALGALVPAARAQSYSAVDLYPYPASWGPAIATGVNDSGTVIYYFPTTSSGTGAYAYTGGTTATLYLYYVACEAFGINAAGTIVGAIPLADWVAVEYAPSSNYVAVSMQGSKAYAINSSGAVVGVGVASQNQNVQHAFLYTPNQGAVDLGTLGGHASTAFAINDSGTVAGVSNTTGDTARHAFSYANGTMTDLGTLGGTTSSASGINAAGVIVGYATTAGDAAQHAFSYANGTMTDLGTLGGTTSAADAINASGVVVGYSTVPSGAKHAFVRAIGGMVDLNSQVNLPGVTLTEATAISGSGLIAANASNGHIYLVVNTPNQVLAFPKPANHTYGDAPFTLGASSSSGLAPVYGVVSGPAVVSGNQLTITGAGTVTIQASQPGNGTFAAAVPIEQTFTVSKATPVITWPTPGSIVYGTPLPGSLFDASASVPGTMAYSPNPGSILGVGNHALAVTFTPADTADYAAVSTQVYFSVTKATPVVTWPGPAPITYGTALSYAQLDAYANVPGTFAYTRSQLSSTTPVAISPGVILASGAQSLNVTFTPADTVDYTPVSASQVLVVNPAPGNYPYTVLDTGTLNNFVTIPEGMNNNGEIVGISQSSGNDVAVAFLGGVLTSLGYIGLPASNGIGNSSALGVNDSGIVVGATTVPGTQYQHAFSYANGTMTDLGTFGGVGSSATAINDAGTITGTIQASNGLTQGFVYNNGSLSVFGAGGTEPAAINSAGTVVGSRDFNGTYQGFVYSGGLIATIPAFGTYNGYSSSSAYGINSSGTVVGSATDSYYRAHAFSYSNGVLTDLGGFGVPSQANGINDAGTIVGSAATNTEPGGQAAFVYTGGVMTDLNTLVNPSGNVLVSAVAINNRGQILAEGGASGSCLLSPNSILAGQTVSLGSLPGRTFGDASFALGATSSSGLAPVYRVVGGPATVSGNTLTLNGAGTVTVQVSQPGDGTYAPASPVTQGFTVARAGATVTLGNLTQYGNGSALAPTVTTAPANLAVVTTYDGVPAMIGVPTGGSLAGYAGAIGQAVYVNVTGSSTGVVYGAGPYGIDSDIRTAAVHAGILANGQTAVLRIQILADQGSYSGTSQNGVTSLPAGNCGGAVQVSGIATTGYTAGPAGPGAHSVTVTVADPDYSGSAGGTFTIVSPAPTFTLSPAPQTVAVGRSVAFNSSALGVPAPAYQWTLNGSTAIPGATVTTDAILLVQGATSANAGTYVCTATNSSGNATASATLSVVSSPSPGFLSNISARADVGTGAGVLVGGYVVGGSGSEPFLLRGVGPGLLSTFKLTGELPAVQLTLFDSGQLVVATNTGWGSAPVPGNSPVNASPAAASSSLMGQLGAFSLASGSTDAAMTVTTPAGGYTAQMSGVGGTSGIALAEIYDAGAGSSATHLINISARANVGVGNDFLVGGFVIGGSTAETVLIRAVGPGLTDTFNLAGTLPQPVLTLFDAGQNTIASNSGWSGDATIAEVAALVGAFALNAGHQDSAVLVTLPPGGYTAQVSGAGAGTGIALVEIYEVR